MTSISPRSFVLFGATGDLAQKKIMPALLRLFEMHKFPEGFSIIAFSRRHWTDEEYRNFITPALQAKNTNKESIKNFLKHVVYVEGTFDNPDSYESLNKKVVSPALYHLATQPEFYESILNGIQEKNIDSRIIIEKPFGQDSKSAEYLASIISQKFDNKQLYLIDHYLGKAGALEFINLRKSDSSFELKHSKEYIDSIHIKLFEAIDIQGRGEFYETIGAIRDVGQNHALQMIALAAMDITKEDESEARKEVFSTIEGINRLQISKRVKRGQYEGYKQEKDVSSNSTIETYFRIEFEIQNERWEGVNFIIEAGKALDKKAAEIVITYKDSTKKSINIEGDASQDVRDAYEFLIEEAIIGNKSHFVSIDEVKASWDFITPILEHIELVPLEIYKRGIYPLQLL